MQYGNWELRDDAVYYPSQNVILYPSSNSADEGSLHLETNVRSIVRRITKKSYKLKDNDFHVTLNSDGKSLNVTAGEANIQGYHLIANRNLTINIPVTTSITPLTLGMCLSYDAANNVTADVVNYDGNDSEVFSGVYLKFFDECNVQNRYDNILMLARVWVKDGTVVSKCIIPEKPVSPYSGWYIENGIENDPFNDHAIYGSKVEVTVNGVNMNCFDAIPAIQMTGTELVTLQDGSKGYPVYDIPNLSDVSKYENMYYELEHNPLKYTKAPTFTTDIQDVINYLPDWFVSKYGDYMSGGLRFDHLTIDAKRQLDEANAVEYSKDNMYDGLTDGKNGKYHNTSGILISPRTLGKLHHTVGTILDISVIEEMYKDGGTIMTIIPQSYQEGIDFNKGRNGGYAALISRTDGDIGLRIRGLEGLTTRVTNHVETTYVTETNRRVDREYFTIEHSDDLDVKYSAITMENYQMYLDTWRSEGIQLFANPDVVKDCVATQITPTGFDIVRHQHNGMRKWASSSESTYLHSDNALIRASIGCNSIASTVVDQGNLNGKDAYLNIGNLAIQANSAINAGVETPSEYKPLVAHLGLIKAEGIEGITSTVPYYDIRNTAGVIPYIRFTPGLYTNREVIEDYIVVGSDSRSTGMLGGHVIENAKTKTVIGLSRSSSISKRYSPDFAQAVFEQTCYFEADNDGKRSTSYNKLITPHSRTRDAGHDNGCGIFSIGNIGASTALIAQHSIDTTFNPYRKDENWVRFTRWRYDNDNDRQYTGDLGSEENIGNIDGQHAFKYGDTYNIEFNTTVANKRSSQLIWHYYNGEQDTAHQPLTLSYIHDEKTAYPNSTYYDHNLYRHQNPTYGVRDFLRLDGGGLSVHGDINNPTLAGDANNDIGHLAVTLVHGRVYSANYNDYAETYEKADTEEFAIAGSVVMLDVETGKYKICDEEESTLVVGVISDNYGMLIGGQTIDTAEEQEKCLNQVDNFTVGVSGKVPVLLEGDATPGDLLVAAATKGYARVADRSSIIPGTVIGKVVSKPYTLNDKPVCMMQIMLS